MKNIYDIFYKNQTPVKSQAVKKIDIEWSQHAVGIYNIGRSLIPDFKIDSYNSDILMNLLLYFTGNKEIIYNGVAKKCNLDLNKGLLIVGGVGSGKSKMFELFRLYTYEILQTNTFQYLLSSQIVKDVDSKGLAELEQYSLKANAKRPIYIDDIASVNENVTHFGTVINVIEQLLQDRYNLFIRNNFLTHATSNKYPAELAKIYDIRTIDRFNEMFNIIELDSPSRRK